MMMTDAMDQVRQLFQTHAIKLLTALGILILGWLVALVLSGFVRLGLHKINIDRRLAVLLPDRDGEKPTRIEEWGSRVVFYLLMVFVLIAFFQTLGLSLITEPLNRFLIQVFDYLPRLLGPAVLLAIAWVVASVLRLIVVKVMSSSRLHRKIEAHVGLEHDARLSMARTLGETVYWMVFLLFFLAILDALALQGLLQPLQGMINQILSYVPQVLATFLILAVGWFIARIVQRLATNVCATIGLDSLSDRVGLSGVLGKQQLSGLIGLLAYIAILIPVLIASLNALKLEAVTKPASDMLNKILGAVPSVFAAVLVLAIAYVAGRIVAQLISNLLASAGFDALLARMGIAREAKKGEHTPSELVGYLGLLAILLFASIEALRLLNFLVLAELMSQFTVFASHVLLGLVIFAVGLYVAAVVAKAVQAGRTPQARWLAGAARVSILALAGAMALREMGLANEIITIAFGGVLGAVAVATAIAFGLGGREIAADLLRDLIGSFKAKR